METVTILRILSRRRRLVACVCVLAVLAGTAVAYHISFPPSLAGRSYHVGVATSRVLIDTPSSQVVEVAPTGSDTLGARAGLIASLMVDGTVKAAIARRAGLRPDQFDGVSKSAAESTPADAPPGPLSRVLTTRVVTNTNGDSLPIIEIEAQAPDRASAARLAGAAVTGLRDYLDTKAAQQRIPGAKRLQVGGLGAPQARDVVRGPRRLYALLAAMFVFAAGCAAIVGASSIAGAWQESSEQEVRDDPAEGASPRAARFRGHERDGDAAADESSAPDRRTANV
jgi:hypothetical protein